MIQSRGAAQLLLSEADLSDRAVQEEVEIAIGTGSDVQTRFVTEEVSIDPGSSSTIPLLPVWCRCVSRIRMSLRVLQSRTPRVHRSNSNCACS